MSIELRKAATDGWSAAHKLQNQEVLNKARMLASKHGTDVDALEHLGGDKGHTL